MFLEPMLLGRYPVDLAPLLDGLAEPGDMATIRQPLDFYGVNYYNPMKIAAAAEDADMPFELRDVVGYPTTDLGWPVVPDALREWLIMFRARYRAALPPIMITESGCAYNMGPDADGVVDDQPRIDYLHAHLTAVARRSSAASTSAATTAGRCWTTSSGPRASPSASGWCTSTTTRCERTPKRSFQWYADAIAAQPGSGSASRIGCDACRVAGSCSWSDRAAAAPAP